jgi:hypothetical protein
MTSLLLNNTVSDGGYIGLYDLESREKGLQDFNLCSVLYEFATTDDGAN